MKNNDNGFRAFLILLVVGVSFYSLWQSITVHKQPRETKEQFIKDNPKIANQAVKFGLDLAGGTHVVVEVDTKNIDDADEVKDVQERSLEIIRNRVDQFGLNEPVITPSGENRIVAALAGLNADKTRELIGGTAKLEFKLVVRQEEFVNVVNKIDNYLRTKSSVLATDTSLTGGAVDAPLDDGLLGGSALDSTVSDSAVAQQVAKQPEAKGLEAFIGKSISDFTATASQSGDLVIPQKYISLFDTLLNDKGVKSLIPHTMQFVWGKSEMFKDREGSLISDNQGEVLTNGGKRLYLLNKRAEMDGKEISKASVNRLSSGLNIGEVIVNLEFKGLGPKKFASVTGNNIGRQLAIVLDDQVISAPVVNDRISTGQAQISGMADMAEGKQLAVVLKAGALPAPMKIIELRSVGATLGEENIHSGLNATLIGLGLVILFMLAYYLGAGINAIIALVFNIIIIGGAMSAFGATLTLPGIAGILLTIGMAVDANVIIFERIKEELKLGKTARSAIASGYDKAFSTIVDANITTFLTAFILYKIGSGPIKGFGVTLMIGIAASFFTAIYVTRFFFNVTMKNNDTKNMKIGSGIAVLNNANWQIITKSKAFAMLSIFLVIASIGLVAGKGLSFGIDFTGGNVYNVRFEQNVSSIDVEKAVISAGIENPLVKTVEAQSGYEFLISTPIIEGSEGLGAKIASALTPLDAKMEVVNEEQVGPSIGNELKWDAIQAFLLSLLIIILYVWLRFGKNGLGFGIGSVIALAHDVIITLGIFAALGLKFDATIVAALLTIVGYSLNDTIVVYDRIRENTELIGKDTFENRVNISVNQSLSRTFITSLTTLIVVVVMAFLGGPAVKDFAIALIIGVGIGTYSSIFVASTFVVKWAKRYSLR